MTKALKAVAFVCTLSPSPAESSTQLITEQVARELQQYDISTEIIRAVDYNIRPGVQTDMGEGDDWPKLRKKMLDADILILATPIWVGHPSSVVQRIIERLDAELSESDDQGRMLTYGKVAAIAVVGNEDGAHKVTADLSQALSDVGFTLPAQVSTYWNGEAMQRVDYKDLKETPEKTDETNKTVARHVAHLAKLLSENPYPPAK